MLSFPIAHGPFESLSFLLLVYETNVYRLFIPLHLKANLQGQFANYQLLRDQSVPTLRSLTAYIAN